MDTPMIGGTVLCALCHQPMTVERTYGPELRTAYCTNRACRTQFFEGVVEQEITLYTAPRAAGPRPLAP
jgi:hypothetical protein